eukprot:1087886-Amphidinium_carterae.1
MVKPDKIIEEAATSISFSKTNILADVSENRWQITSTLLRMIRWLDGKVNEHTLQKRFFVIIDAAPCHVSAEYRAEVKKEIPCMAYMRPLKCALKRAAGKSFAEDCLTNPANFNIAVGLAANGPKLPTMPWSVMSRDSIHSKGWKPFHDQQWQKWDVFVQKTQD